jgi:hypothetical protein
MDNGLFGGEKTTTDEGRILLASSVSCRVCLVAGLVGLWAPVFFLFSPVFGLLALVIGKLVFPACELDVPKLL